MEEYSEDFEVKRSRLQSIQRNKYYINFKQLSHQYCNLTCVTSNTKISPFKLNRPFTVAYTEKENYVEDGVEENGNWNNVITDKNWYYTGGNLQIQNTSHNIFIYHTSNRNNLSLTHLNYDNNTWHMQEQKILSKNPSPIYQIKFVKYHKKSFLGIRDIGRIKIYKLKRNEKCKLVNTIESVVPFIHMNLDGINTNEYVTINAINEMTIWDTITNQSVSTVNIPNDEFHKGNIYAENAYLDTNVIVCVNKSDFFIYDKRVGELKNVNVFNKPEKEIFIKNDFISNLCLNKTDKVKCYVTTTNNVLCTDIRSKSVLCSWSHKLTNSPCLSDFIVCDDTDTLCMSNCRSDEKLILGHRENICFLPQLFPTLTDLFERNLLAKQFTRTVLLMKEHFSAVTTGLQAVPMDRNSFVLFSTNEFGDLFGYAVNNDENEQNVRNLNARLLSKYIPEPLCVVDRVSLKELKLDNKTEPVKSVNVKKQKEIENCVQDIKNMFRSDSCLKSTWFDVAELVDEVKILKDLENANPTKNVENWLSNIETYENNHDDDDK